MSKRSRQERIPRRPAARAAWRAIWFAACFGLGMAASLPARRFLARPSDGDRPPAAPASAEPGPQAKAAFAAHFQRGIENLNAEKYAEALEDFSRAAQAAPAVPDAPHYQGEVYTKLYWSQRAEEAFRRALALDPGYRPSIRSLAMLLHEDGRYAEAVELLQRLQKESPNDSFIIGELAINALALGKPADAVELLKKYNAMEPRQAWGYTHLGRAYADSGSPDQAEAAYREALSIDPRFPLAHYWLGQLLTSRGRAGESSKVLVNYRRLRQMQNDEHLLGMALLRNPDDLRSLVRLARVRLLLGRPREARAAFERARALAPEDPEVKEIGARLAAPPPARE